MEIHSPTAYLFPHLLNIFTQSPSSSIHHNLFYKKQIMTVFCSNIRQAQRNSLTDISSPVSLREVNIITSKVALRILVAAIFFQKSYGSTK